MAEELKDDIRRLLGNITERDRAILDSRCLGERTRTQQELADEFGVTPSRVAQGEQRLKTRIEVLARQCEDSLLGQEWRRLYDERESYWRSRIASREETDANIIEITTLQPEPELPMLMRIMQKKTLPRCK